MKVASIILTILGVIINFISAGMYSTPIYYVVAIIGAVIGVCMLASLSADKKVVALGILGIIFTGTLGGIFYLCWKPEE